MTPPKSSPTVPARTFAELPIRARLVILGAFVLYVVMGLATLHQGHPWGDDWAQYLAHARNIATGLPYGSTGYLFNPDAAGIGPAVSQPGLPLLLSPVYAVFGQNLIIFKALLFLVFCAGLPLLVSLSSRSYGIATAIAAVSFLALIPEVLGYRQQILTEYPYMFFSIAALWFAVRREPNTPSRVQLAWSVAAGLALTCAYATRVVGMALLVAILASDLLSRRSLLRSTLPMLLVFAFGFLALKLTATADYSQQIANTARFQTESDGSWLASASGRAIDVFDALRSILPAPLKQSAVSATLFLVLAVLGFIMSMVRRRQEGMRAGDGGVWSWIPYCPVEALYVGAYLCMLIVLPTHPDSRLLLPILPFMVGAAAFALAMATQATGGLRASAVAVVALLAALYLGLLYARTGQPPFSPQPAPYESEQGAYCGDCRQLYDAIAKYTSRDARIAFAKPRALALITGRTSWTWLDTNPEDVTLASMKSLGIAYLVVPRDKHVLTRHYPAYFSWQALAGRPEFPLEYENDSFRMYRVMLP